MMTNLGMGTTPQKTTTMSRLRRTRRQGVSCAPGCPTRTTTETMAGTPMMETIVMTALEMMASTGAVATSMSAQVL
jgi:hypothetical protein